MTTTVIYELIASISDDAEGRRFCRSRGNTDDQSVNLKTGLNITDFTDCNAIGWTASLPEASGKKRNNVRSAQDVMGSRLL